VSHYPASFPSTMGTIAGTGMNALELQANKQLTGGFKQSDLNRNSTLPFPDNSFDVVTCVVRMPLVFAPPLLQALLLIHRANDASNAHQCPCIWHTMLNCVLIIGERRLLDSPPRSVSRSCACAAAGWSLHPVAVQPPLLLQGEARRRFMLT